MPNMQLHNEIRTVQSQLKTAIQNHQMIVFKLKDRPVSIKLRVQMCNIQRHIVSLGERQKKLLTQLRQELEANGGSMKMSPLQNLRPNPLYPQLSSKSQPIKKELINIKCESILDGYENTNNIQAKPEVPHTSRRKSKLVAITDLPLTNGHSVPSPTPVLKENTPSSTPSSSPTHSSNPVKQPKQRTARVESIPTSSVSDESQDAFVNLPADPETRKKLQFMTALSLVTREVLTELKNRRTERKRRSTANPHFLYGSILEQKRKRTSYLAKSPAVDVPSISTSGSSKANEEENSPQSACMSCTSTNGSLSKCAVCQKSFHWIVFMMLQSLNLPREESSIANRVRRIKPMLLIMSLAHLSLIVNPNVFICKPQHFSFPLS
ncbi:uncharacterized protein LOC117649971 [Thrips palmi]|uniref:Uncharacterized protein LOC117649971 n=1 Tax=Thrips palmi TaxID=161013 RepID=A0A6P8ZVD5_THRPL|nr:uncharacterized protein LOC117649971 [Thrips palmi]